MRSVHPCPARVHEAELRAPLLQPLPARIEDVGQDLGAFLVRASAVDDDVDVSGFDKGGVGG